MSSPLRSQLASRLSRATDGDERAAVALIFAGGDRHVGLIRRAERRGDPWSGHMALPGGKREPSDTTLLATAIRETREEIGLALSEDQYFGRLPTLTTLGVGLRSGLAVAPFLFEIDRVVHPNHRSEEVAELVWAPLDELRSEARRSRHRLEVGGAPLEFPAIDFDGRLIWGLTHRILTDVLELAPG